MNKITIAKIIDFKNKPEKNKLAFLNKLKQPKEISSEGGGGNYWVRSISAISKAYKTNDNQHIKNKINDILNDNQNTSVKPTKLMYDRNLKILYNYENFDFIQLKPVEEFKILEKRIKKAIIHLNTIPIQVSPQHIFTFTKNDTPHIGAIWFIAKLEPLKEEDLGIFSEALFELLVSNFSDKFIIAPQQCITIDVLYMNEINFEMVLNQEIPSLLKSTLEEMKKLII